MPTGIKFITSLSGGPSTVGVGLSTIVGPTGPAGAFGGPQGLQGPSGGGSSTGAQGNQGFQGNQGLAGITGTQGNQGNQGNQGTQGTQGNQGFQGNQGNQGSQGNQGFQGNQGNQGYQGNQGNQGLVGQGFKVFATTPSYTGLNTIIATGGNIGEFVLVTGGDLFVYSGTGAGSTGPDNSYEYAGDVTDESKLIGLQGAIGPQGSQGNIGFQGSQYTGPFTDITFSGNMSGANAYLQNLAAENFASQGAIIGFDGLTVVGPTNLISVLNATGGLTTTNATVNNLVITGSITVPTGALVGYQGNQGLRGTTGSQGNQGLIGNQGPTGPAGIINISSGSYNSIIRFENSDTIKDSKIILGDIGDMQNVANISFALNTGSSITQGTLYWDNADNTKTLNLVMNTGGVVQQIGEETYFRVKAQSSITNGQVVMFAGTLGSSVGVLASPASGITSSTAEYIMGIATENLATNDWGYITHFGIVRGIDTSGGGENWIDGDLVYYNPLVAGGLTKYIPTGNNPKVLMAAVMHASPSNGSLLVRPSFGGILGQFEGDVYFQNKSTGDYLYYNGSYWTNRQLPQVGGVSSQFIFNNNGEATGSFSGLYFTGTSTGSNIYAGSSILPSQNATYNLGSPDNLWKSIYISTGTVFIGPTGTLGLDNNGIISSAAGFATPFLTVGSTNPGAGIKLYNNQNNLWFQNQSGASGPVSIWNVASNNINNAYFTGGNLGIGIDNPTFPLTVKGTIYCEGLTGTNLPIGPQGNTGPQGNIGPQGTAGTNGASDSTIFYLDTVGGAYAGVARTGALMIIPDTSNQTTITATQTNTTINIANFLSAGVPSTTIIGGNWDLNLFGFASTSSAVSFYFDVLYVDADGVSNPVHLAGGTGASSVFINTTQALYTNTLYVPTTILPDLTKRILLKIFIIFSGNNRSVTLEFRDGTVSHLHTTLFIPQIAAGHHTQVIFNQSGAYTGSNNLTFNNNRLTTSNMSISSSTNATGSATGALIVTGGINVNGESVFNSLVYAPSLNPNFINRGNPGQASPLLLSNYNTVHYYSTTSATGFIDISTTMVENAVYEVEFNCYGANASNNDMFLYPNYTFTGSGTPFYMVYTQSPSTGGLGYISQNQKSFYFDYVSGVIGYDPVGKIKIFNNRSGKKIKVEAGDTTAVVNGHGYWTAGAGTTNNSGSAPIYDTTTQWSNIGRLLFSDTGNVTFTNWNVWVKRIM